MKKYRGFIISLIFITSLFPIYQQCYFFNQGNIPSSLITIKSSDSTPILIQNNSYWQTLKDGGFCEGNGTIDDPFLLRNLVINASGYGYCIRIETTTVYYKIENCTFLNCGGSEYGALYLYEASNGVIVNNTFIGNYYGLRNVKSNYIDVINNTFNTNIWAVRFIGNVGSTYAEYFNLDNNTFFNNSYGIHMFNYCRYFNITNNYFQACDTSVKIHGAHYTSILNNTIIDGGYSGIFIDGIIIDCYILNNTIRNVYYEGMHINGYSPYWGFDIEDNTVISCEYGIYVGVECEYGSITHNRLLYNTYCLYIDSSSNNIESSENTCVPDDEYESNGFGQNDKMVAATDLLLDRYENLITFDEDWYRINFYGENAIFEFLIEHSIHKGNLNMELYNKNGTLLQSITNTQEIGIIEHQHDSSINYDWAHDYIYLKIWSDTLISYNLSIARKIDTNIYEDQQSISFGSFFALITLISIFAIIICRSIKRRSKNDFFFKF